MPVIHIYHNNFNAIKKINAELVKRISDTLFIPKERVWLFWHNQTENYECSIWNENEVNPPIIFIYCKSAYSETQIINVINEVKQTFDEIIGDASNDIFVGIQRFPSGELFVNQMLYKNETMDNNIILHPIGYVSNDRKEITDDNWGEVRSEIILVDSILDESLRGLSDFSHIHVIFHFHKVQNSKIVLESRHPRNNPNLPKVGIFAQRAKNRLNKIGSTVCEIIKVEKNKIVVKGLDAIHGTPVLDIKPYMIEFDLRETKQPFWTKEIMKNYF